MRPHGGAALALMHPICSCLMAAAQHTFLCSLACFSPPQAATRPGPRAPPSASFSRSAPPSTPCARSPAWMLRRSPAWTLRWTARAASTSCPATSPSFLHFFTTKSRSSAANSRSFAANSNGSARNSAGGSRAWSAMPPGGVAGIARGGSLCTPSWRLLACRRPADSAGRRDAPNMPHSAAEHLLVATNAPL